MIGLLALLTFLLLIVVAWVISGWLTLWMKKLNIIIWLRLLLHWSVRWMIVVLLLKSLFIDEYLGEQQFQALCEKNATTIRIDAAKAKGKTVKLEVDPYHEAIAGFLLPVYRSHYSYRDVNTGEEIAQYDRYIVKGGWFSRVQPFDASGSKDPITFERSWCEPENSQSFQKEYGLTLISKFH